jgi:DNA polymerase-3 subunit delta'
VTLSGIIGHAGAVRALQHALEADQIAGTYLFTGPEGVGKTTLALAFAKAAACLDPSRSPFDACGVCESCRRVASASQPEIVIIPPAGDQTQIWQFWDRDGKPGGKLENTLIHSPVIGRKRVFIIEKAETLTIPAANSLLKVLEEPPSYAVFLLLATHPARMLPTILSRSMILRLTPAPLRELADHLQRVLNISREQAMLFSAYAEGRVGTAYRLASNPKAFETMDDLASFTFQSAKLSPLEMFKYAERIRKKAATSKALLSPEGDGAEDEADEPSSKEKVGRTQIGTLLELMGLCYRDLMAAAIQGEEAELIFINHRDEILRLSSGRSPEGWRKSLDLILKARRSLDRNVSVPLLMDWLSVRLTCQNR